MTSFGQTAPPKGYSRGHVVMGLASTLMRGGKLPSTTAFQLAADAVAEGCFPERWRSKFEKITDEFITAFNLDLKEALDGVDNPTEGTAQ
jgi:hypothetical protein